MKTYEKQVGQDIRAHERAITQRMRDTGTRYTYLEYRLTVPLQCAHVATRALQQQGYEVSEGERAPEFMMELVGFKAVFAGRIDGRGNRYTNRV